MFCQDGWLNRKPREEFVPRGQWHCMPSNIKGAAIASKASYCMLWCGMTKCYLYIGSRPLIQFLCDSLQSQGSVSNSSNSTKTIVLWSTKIVLPKNSTFSSISEYLLKCQFSHQLNFYGYLEMLLEVLTYMLFEIENLVDFQSKVFG